MVSALGVAPGVLPRAGGACPVRREAAKAQEQLDTDQLRWDAGTWRCFRSLHGRTGRHGAVDVLPLGSRVRRSGSNPGAGEVDAPAKRSLSDYPDDDRMP